METVYKVYTGNKELDEILNNKDRFYLIYGDPGTGKTNLVSKIARESVLRGSSVAYVCTEGSVNVTNLLNDPEIIDRDIKFAFPTTLTELLKAVITLLVENPPDVIIIDTINYLYRIEGGYSYRSNEIFISIISILHYISRTLGRYVLATAQVRETEEGLEPSGIVFLDFYRPYMIRSVKRDINLFEIILEKDNQKFLFSIRRKDLVWRNAL
ncbi:MAG: AAA family ATPase [Sulfolobales archaeon]